MVENNEIQNDLLDAGGAPEKVINTTFFNRMFAWKKISAQNENSMEKLNAKITELETSCSKIHEELSVEVEGNKQQVEKYNELKDDFVKTASNLTDVEKQLAVEKEKNSNLTIKVSDIKQKYEDVSRQLKEEQTKYENERDHSTNLTGEVAEKVLEISNLNARVSDIEHKYEDVSQQLKEEQEKFLNEYERSTDLTSEVAEKASEISDLNTRLSDIELKYEDTSRQLKEEQERSTNLTSEVAEKASEISSLSEQVSALQKEKTERESVLLKTWKEHVNRVAEKLDSYANKYNYIKISTEDYQYAGSPQNVFQFCKQYTIFDAISPESLDDLKNFRTKVKEYAEEMKKYYKTDLLRTDAYLVVPTSTVAELDSTTHYFPGYVVHVITPENLLPILTMLATLETYDFANQISAEGRDKICSLLAKLSYIAKKKVQADTLYSKDLISTLREIKTLPSQYTNAIAHYEERKNLLEFDALSSNVDKIEQDYIGYALEESKDNENGKN